jgi:hypothetical protein
MPTVHHFFLLWFTVIFLEVYILGHTMFLEISYDFWGINFIYYDRYSFHGYVLPWGQMSFWAATVITNLASAIPIYGVDVVIWFWELLVLMCLL